jgi:riboflavin biosynthesis pyrimidine reductase
MQLPISFEGLRTAEDTDAAVAAMFGAGAAGLGVPQILHVAAVWARPDGTSAVMRITEETPRSAHDFFALNLARARADAIVITGKILREEANLHYATQGPGSSGAALARWRREKLGKSSPPVLLVLTGRPLDLDHPALRGDLPVVIYTTEASARVTAERADSSIEVVGAGSPSLRGALEHLSAGRGCRTISIEAGPSTSLGLYEPLAVDELMLSRFHGDALPEHIVGGDFPGPRTLESLFPARHDHPRIREANVSEPSGRWSFARYLRPSPRSHHERASNRPRA